MHAMGQFRHVLLSSQCIACIACARLSPVRCACGVAAPAAAARCGVYLTHTSHGPPVHVPKNRTLWWHETITLQDTCSCHVFHMLHQGNLGRVGSQGPTTWITAALTGEVCLVDVFWHLGLQDIKVTRQCQEVLRQLAVADDLTQHVPLGLILQEDKLAGRSKQSSQTVQSVLLLFAYMVEGAHAV